MVKKCMFITKETHLKLKEMKKEMKYDNFSNLIEYLIKEYNNKIL